MQNVKRHHLSVLFIDKVKYVLDSVKSKIQNFGDIEIIYLDTLFIYHCHIDYGS